MIRIYTSKWLPWFLLLSCILGMGFSWDFSRFIKHCEKYTSLANHPKLPADVTLDEAIVVLTGDKGRIPKALDLLRMRQSPLLIISGIGKGITLQDILNRQGDAAKNIPELWNKIIVESTSQSTVDNVYESGKIILEKKISRIILISSDYHMPRSMKIFKKVLPGIHIVPYAILSDFSVSGSGDRRNFLGWWVGVTEYLKLRVFEWNKLRSLIPL